MARLVYSAICSLDGYIEDKDGSFDWAVPDDEVHAFINDLERTTGTCLYGRRMYETMSAWESDSSLPELSPVMRDFADIWRESEKVVYSSTIEAPWTERTRVERTFEPEAVRELKAEARQDISIGGPELAAHAFRARLVDECQLFLAPIIVGSGKPALPRDVRLDLALQDERRFRGGFVFLRYQIRAES